MENNITETFNDCVAPKNEVLAMTVGAVNNSQHIVIGENHAATASTMKLIADTINGACDKPIQGIILELPVNMQSIFQEEILNDKFKFEIEFRQAMLDSKLDAAMELLGEGYINNAQFTALVESFELDALAIGDLKSSDNELLLRHDHQSFREMALTALDQNIPVIAADVDRKRLVAFQLSRFDDESLRIDGDTLHAIMSREVDDRSDFELISQFGFDIDDPTSGVLIVHRGLAHLTNVLDKNSPTVGADEVLEGSSMGVLVIANLPAHFDPNRDVPDPVDISIAADASGSNFRITLDNRQPVEHEIGPYKDNSLTPAPF
jgi:hypothetical protein